MSTRSLDFEVGMKINSDTRFTRRWELYDEFLNDDNFESFDFFLTQRLMEAEARAAEAEERLQEIEALLKPIIDWEWQE